MCAFCGTLGAGRHWSDTRANPAAFANRAGTHTWRRERQERTRLLNLVLAPHGLSVSDWEGAAYQLRTRTGQTVLVDTLGALWPAAEALLKRPCDPLDPDYLTALAGGTR